MSTKTTRYGVDDDPVFVIDPSRCIGCEACVAACAESDTHRGRSLIHLERVDRADILRRAAAGEVVVLDVRPQEEFAVAHLPHARSLPVSELKKRIAELPKDVPVVAYCRGPFCLMAKDAVELLRRKGYQAFHLTDGVAEWRARGLPVAE